jgi:cold-inducible RNA-binding protein
MGTKLFVGNLSYSITEEELREAFSQSARTVQSVRIAVDRETQRPRGFAFVEVATDAEADSAIKEWNNMILAGRTVFVEKAQERAPGAPRPVRGPRPPGAPGGPGGPGDGASGPPRSFNGPPRPGGFGAGPGGPPRPFGGPPRSFTGPPPAAISDNTRDGGRRRSEKPERKDKRRASGRPEERERGKWRWDGNDDY